jgi:hypothetical protein
MPSRIIREGVLTSLRVDKLSEPAELFYRRLQSVADDYGRYISEPRLLRSAVYPLRTDKFSTDKINALLGECTAAGLIVGYRAEEKDCLAFLDFRQQTRSKSRYPAPPAALVEKYGDHLTLSEEEWRTAKVAIEKCKVNGVVEQRTQDYVAMQSQTNHLDNQSVPINTSSVIAVQNGQNCKPDLVAKQCLEVAQLSRSRNTYTNTYALVGFNGFSSCDVAVDENQGAPPRTDIHIDIEPEGIAEVYVRPYIEDYDPSQCDGFLRDDGVVVYPNTAVLASEVAEPPSTPPAAPEIPGESLEHAATPYSQAVQQDGASQTRSQVPVYPVNGNNPSTRAERQSVPPLVAEDGFFDFRTSASQYGMSCSEREWNIAHAIWTHLDWSQRCLAHAGITARIEAEDHTLINMAPRNYLDLQAWQRNVGGRKMKKLVQTAVAGKQTPQQLYDEIMSDAIAADAAYDRQLAAYDRQLAASNTASSGGKS